MNVFLAGASGVIGRPCTQILVARGHRVFAMTRRAELGPRLLRAGAIPIVADALDAEAVRLALHATRPDAVIHQLTDLSALYEDLDEAVRRNAKLRKAGTANLVAAAQAADVPAMVAQSIAWVYASGTEPHVESDPLDTRASGNLAITVDGVTTLEKAVLTTPGLRGCVVRYGQFYGPGTPRKDAGGGSIPIPVHVEAAAWAAVLAVEAGASGLYNVADANAHVDTGKVRREWGWKESLRA